MKIERLATAAAAAAALLTFAGPSSAELIELENGGVLQGKVVPGRTTDEALALELFDTGGELMVRWDHVMASRRKALREHLGIDIPPDQQVLVPGHRVQFTTGGSSTEFKLGVVRNPGARGQPPGLVLKTNRGEATYDWESVGAVDEMEIDGLVAYTKEELYQIKLDEFLPETAKAHFDMAVLAQQIGMFDKAKEHFETAATDEDFVTTGEGRSIEQRLKQIEVLIRAAGATELVNRIKQTNAQNKWNDSLETLKKLAEDFPDEAIRKAIKFERVETQVLKGRDKYFRRRVQLVLYSQMDTLTLNKAREKKPRKLEEDANRPRGSLTPGTIAAAKRWAAREFPAELWGKVGERLGLEIEEVDKFWKERSSRKVRTASYGTGSFIVMKRAKKAGGDKRKKRRPPPGSRSRGNRSKGPQKQKQAAKPLTEQEWWASVGARDKAHWLKAYFVETSGLFDVIRADEDDACSNCGGLGIIKVTSTGGSGQDSTFCKQCNGSGHFRKVKYR